MKKSPTLEIVEKEARAVLTETLSRFGNVLENHWTGRTKGRQPDPGYDLKQLFRMTKGTGREKTWCIQAEIKTVLHPKQASHAIWSLKRSKNNLAPQYPTYQILIAPYISKQVAAMCEEENIGHLDLSGNCHLEFGGIWIERRGLPRKYKEDRNQKSLFTPKAARILRVLLRGPLRPHKVEDLAHSAEVSLGLVSKVRNRLLEQLWAKETPDGIQITEPDTILKHWLEADKWSERTEIREYSTLISEQALAKKLVTISQDDSSVSPPIFTLNFAAWLRAPHNVPTTISAYMESFPDGDFLRKSLQARPVPLGAGNLRLIVPNDFKGIELEKQHTSKFPEFETVSDLQLYLDLHGGERNGAEQAEVLRELEDFNGTWT